MIKTRYQRKGMKLAFLKFINKWFEGKTMDFTYMTETNSRPFFGHKTIKFSRKDFLDMMYKKWLQAK